MLDLLLSFTGDAKCYKTIYIISLAILREEIF